MLLKAMTAEVITFYADTPIGTTGEVLKTWSDGKRKWYKLYFGKNLSGQKLIVTTYKANPMEKQLFDTIIKLCVLMSTTDRTEQKESPLWKDVEQTIFDFQVKYPDYKTDIGYDRVMQWRSAQLLKNLNPSISGSLKVAEGVG